MALDPGGRVGHFDILGLLGAGGMGDVYHARDTRLGRDVALKLLPARLVDDPACRARFEREARLLAALSHPGIATLYGLEEARGALVLVMELVTGETLAARLRRGPVALAETLAIGRQLADALDAAHQKGIVHRDLKPANVMVDPSGRVKVLDFGVARLTADDATRTADLTRPGVTQPGAIVGTVPYMSPEQLAGQPLDPRSDLFSFGVLLYELIAGRRPFAGDSVVAIMHAILHREPPSLDAAGLHVPGDLVDVLSACLQKDPRRRVRSAAEIRDRLDRIERTIGVGPMPRSEAQSRSLAPSPKSIVVLPFVNMSADRDQEYFCDGMAEEIINALTKLEGLHVVARTSAFAFKGKNEDVREVGRKLGVTSVLEGSVRKAGERLRVTAQLINVEDGYHVWSERFDRTLEDVFEVQDAIALAIADRLKVTLLHEERARLTHRHTNDRQAYELYLKGRYVLNRRHRGDPERAVAYFRQAIERDPDYVLPHLGISEIFGYLGIWSMLPPHEAFPQAQTAAMRALALDDTLGEAHAVAGVVELLYTRNWDVAERHARRALEIGLPSALGYGWIGLVLSALGRTSEATRIVAQAIERDPISPVAFMLLGGNLTMAGRPGEGAAALHKALELDPDLLATNLWLGWSLVLNAEPEAATPFLQKCADAGVTLGLGLLAAAQASTGRRAEAEASLARLDELARTAYVAASTRALALAGFGRMDEAMDWMERSAAQGEPAIAFANTTIFEPLRSHPRFAELAKRTGPPVPQKRG